MKTRQGNLSIKKVVVEEKGIKYTTWRIDGYGLDGKRIRFSSQDQQAAKLKLAELQTAVHNVDADNPIRLASTRLTDPQLRDAECAISLLAGRGSLFDVVKRALDGGNGIATYLPKIPLSEAVRAFLESQKERVRPRVILAWKGTLSKFEEFSRNPYLGDVNTDSVAKFMASLRTRDGLECASPKTRNNVRGDLHTFFAWCADTKGWISGNPASKAPVARIDRDLIDILPLIRCQELMAHTASFSDGKAARFFAIALFAGVRPGEITRLLSDTRAIDLENNVIHISAAVSKTRDGRTVTIQPNLKKWLVRFPNGATSNNDRSIRDVRKQFKLSHDILRHTFISSHVTSFGSFAETAIEAGNSESIIRKHYYARVTKPDAAAFWEIKPQADDMSLS